MTRPICVLSSAIRSHTRAIAAFHNLRHIPVDFSHYRVYVAGSLCIMGMGLFSAVHIPGAIAHQHTPLAYFPISSGAQGDVQLLGGHSVFDPPDDIGLPERREAGGTR